ncbi:hypothetical protein LTS14_000723 [Recurvomyces mirabilis]|uniref:uncharacterized protein n=1 Tax=Recurvomyces mirabilis TaxID=574656 RepID=UPI002DE03AA0|nr:hypothetical protein LTS14_000723 [Recurvomyces mirabilis]
MASYDDKAAAIERLEEADESSRQSDTNVEDPRVPTIRRRVDKRLCLVLGLLYIVNQIDRINLPVAVVAGLTKDVKLVGNQYSIIVLAFFPTYVIVQPFATPVCRLLGPRPFLSTIIFLWGIAILALGFSKNFALLTLFRACLGALEGGFFPGALFLLSMWYVRSKRNAALYLMGNGASGFGGILAYGLMQTGNTGVGGLEKWQWIFIWEGVITCIAAMVAYIFIVDFPEDASKSWKFLSPDEAQVMIDRVDKDRGDAHLPPFSLKSYLKTALDWKVWSFAANFGLSAVVTYSVAYFLPIVLKNELGFSQVAALCLPAPCYAFGAILGLTESWLSDKYSVRGPLLIINATIEIIGISVLGYAANPSVRFFGAFLVVGGSNANVPASLTYQAVNIVGQWKRAFCSATIVGMGGIGGIIGSLAFRSKDAPAYRPGLYCCLTAAALTVVNVLCTTLYMIRKNRLQAMNRAVLEGVEGFRYTI